MTIKSKYGLNRTAYIDVDGTLIKEGALNNDLVEWIKNKREKGWEIVLWSARGKDHAVKAADENRITEIFDHFLEKPGIIVDDNGLKWLNFVVTINDF